MSNFSTPPQAPATGSSAYAPPSQWPTVIGSIAIAFGAIGGIMALYGLVSMALMTGGGAGMPAGFELPSDVKAFSVLDGFLGLLFAAMLLVGGISVVRRRAGGVKLLRTYAIVRLVVLIPLAVGQGWAGNQTAKAMFEAMEKQSSDSKAAAVAESPESPESPGMPVVTEKSGAITVTSADGSIEVEGGTVQPADGAVTTVITDSGGARVVISGDGKATVAPSTKAKSRPSEAEAMKAFESFMPAIVAGTSACSALLSAIWPIVILVMLSSAQRKAETSAWPSGL